MKRTLLVLLLAASCLFTVTAQSESVVTAEDMSASFQDFSEAVASSLAFNTAIGLSWSDAYIGQLFDFLPNLGIGLTAGATFVPLEDFEDVFTALDMTLPSELKDVGAGLPIPALVVDARIGGLFFPFDIGLKAMTITPDDQALLAEYVPVTVEYTNFGVDIRFPLVVQSFLKPDISIGFGYNYLQGFIGVPMPDSASTSVEIPDPDNPYVTRLLEISAGDLGFAWSSEVYEVKAQISKTFLWLVTPYLGGAVSMSSSKAGGGYKADVTLGGVPLTEEKAEQIKEAFETQGIEIPSELTEDGMFYMFPDKGVSARVFGGLSLNILLLRLDATAHYNLMNGAYGASLGARLQM